MTDATDGLRLTVKNTLSNNNDSDSDNERVIQHPNFVTVVRGFVKVCNSHYGTIGWTGHNDIYLSDGCIVASNFKINDSYLNSQEEN